MKLELVKKENFNKEIDGVTIGLFYLESETGVKASFTNYGARIVNFIVQDLEGKDRDIVLGYDHIDAYINGLEPYHGAIIGRYCNRIAGAEFDLEGQKFKLNANEGNHILHGGSGGFHQCVWKLKRQSKSEIEFELVSPHGDMGFPGRLAVNIKYKLQGQELSIEYSAISDQDTYINLTNHAYFNLADNGYSNVLKHYYQFESDTIAEVGSDLIPTGRLVTVAKSVFDFEKAKQLESIIIESVDQLKFGKGFDHHFHCSNENGQLRKVVQIQSPDKSLEMIVKTTAPGFQFYTANHFTGVEKSRYGIAYGRNAAFCIETQYPPNAPNVPHFPSSLLKKGDEYCSKTVFGITTKEKE